MDQDDKDTLLALGAALFASGICACLGVGFERIGPADIAVVLVFYFFFKLEFKLSRIHRDIKKKEKEDENGQNTGA